MSNRTFDILCTDGTMTFLEFMNYALMMLEGTQQEKANFLFRFISSNQPVFVYTDLVLFYRLINATEDKLSYHSIVFEEKEPLEELMAKITWAVIGKDVNLVNENSRNPFRSTELPNFYQPPNQPTKGDKLLSPEARLNSVLHRKDSDVEFKTFNLLEIPTSINLLSKENIPKIIQTTAKSSTAVTSNEFEQFILANPSHVELFNFIQGPSKQMIRSFRLQKNYADFMRRIEGIEDDIRNLQLVVFRGDQNFMLPQTSRFYVKYNAAILKMFYGHDTNFDSGNSNQNIRRTVTEHNFLAQAFGSLRNAYVQDLNLLKRMTTMNQNGQEEYLKNELHDQNDISSFLEADSDKEILYPNETTKPFDKKVNLKNLELNLFKLVIQKLEKLKLRLNTQMEQLTSTNTFSKMHLAENPKKFVNSDKTKKVVFVNNKNWNIVTSMINGIYKSVNINANDKYHILSKIDFKIHNKLEMESVFSTAFNRCKFKDYAPHVFQNIRSLFGVKNDDYIRSIGVDTFRNAFFDKLVLMLSENSSGKSGSFFFHTADGKYMIKTIKPPEFAALKAHLYCYYQHIQENPRTLLTRYFGLHEIKCYNNTNLIYDIYIVVMNNVFDLDDPLSITEKYDLKGSSYGRMTTEEEIKLGSAMKDNNWISPSHEKLVIKSKIKAEICFQIESDAQFLANNNIIDYSLLVGVVPRDKDSNQIPMFDMEEVGLSKQGKKGSFIENTSGDSHFYIGIIDALTPFNAFKRSEYLVKRIFQGKGISCLPPQKYKERFIDFMSEKVFISEDKV
jgi:hypothetical protein